MTIPDKQPQGEWDELVAYLDGEVTEEVRIAIETRLADDEDYRKMLLALQESWQLLDKLSRIETGPAWTQSTISMVATDLQTEIVRANANSASRWARRRRWGPPLMAAFLAALLGYVATANFFEQRHRRELRDLSVAQHLDYYRYGESLEFLRQLEESQLFADEEVLDEF